MYKVLFISLIVHVHIPPLLTSVEEGTVQPGKDGKGGSHSEELSCNLKIKKEECNYEANVCQNNVYDLTKKIQETQPKELDFCYIIIVFKPVGSNLIWLLEQREGREGDGKAIFGYHVFLIVSKDGNNCVYDLHSRLSFPVQLTDYTMKTFGNQGNTVGLFRIVRAKTFLDYFLKLSTNIKLEGTNTGVSEGNKSFMGRNRNELIPINCYVSERDIHKNGPEKIGIIVNERSFIEMFESNDVSKEFDKQISIAKERMSK